MKMSVKMTSVVSELTKGRGNRTTKKGGGFTASPFSTQLFKVGWLLEPCVKWPKGWTGVRRARYEDNS